MNFFSAITCCEEVTFHEMDDDVRLVLDQLHLTSPLLCSCMAMSALAQYISRIFNRIGGVIVNVLASSATFETSDNRTYRLLNLF
jgi:hypothetical protein